jgi:hypothetical protein
MSMRKVALIAAFVAVAMAAQPAWAASKQGGRCYSQAALEAEQAIRYMTELMVISSACQNTTYAEFRLRNKDAIIAYQKAMISHFRSTPAFDKWNTTIANQAAKKQSAVALGEFCQKAEAMLQQANALDHQAFRAFAAAQAAANGNQYAKCAK